MRALSSPFTRLAAAAFGTATIALLSTTLVSTEASETVSFETVLLEGATEASVDVQLDAGRLWLGGGSMATGMVVDQSELLRGEFASQGGQGPVITYHAPEQGDEAHVVIAPPESDSIWTWSMPERKWSLFLNPTVPTTLDVQIGTGDAELVVGGMLLSELAIEAGSGSVTLDLTGDWRTSLTGTIEIGAGDVIILAPRDTGVKLVAEQGVGAVGGEGFRPVDGAYVNAAYGTSLRTIELHVEQGAGSITLTET